VKNAVMLARERHAFVRPMPTLNPPRGRD